MLVSRHHLRERAFALACLGAVAVAPAAHAQISDDVVKIGVLVDATGPYRDIGGPGSLEAVKLAIEDFGGKVKGKPVVAVIGDHMNKADVGLAIVNRWFDVEQVDAITDLSISSVALATQGIAKQKKKTLLITGAVTSDLTGKACSPLATHWVTDSFALAQGTAKAVVKMGGKNWFFLTVDYSFGHTMEREAGAVVTAAGGKVVGSVRHPMNTPDMSSFILQAQAAKPDIVGLANVGPDMMNSIKLSKEYALSASLAGFTVYITDIHALGLAAAQGLQITSEFYWDRSDASRAWSKRFFDRIGKMPTKEQALNYAAVTHYLRAIDATGTDAADVVNAQMRKVPADFFGRKGRIRNDGRVMFDLSLYQVKKPSESKYPWDYYKELTTISAEEAFRPEGDGGCDLTR